MRSSIKVAVLLWAAIVGATMATKAAQVMSVPTKHEAGATYVGKVFGAVETGGTATHQYDVLWYDGTGDGTATETAMQTDNIASGSLLEADPMEDVNTYLTAKQVTAPVGSKYHRLLHQSTFDEDYKVFADPLPLELAADKRGIVPGNVLTSHMDLGVPGQVGNGDMEIPNLTGTLPDGFEATGTYEYGTPGTSNYNGQKAVTLGGVVGTHTLLSPFFQWGKASPGLIGGSSLLVIYLSTLNELDTTPTIPYVRFFDLTKTQTGSDVQLKHTSTGTVYEEVDGDDNPTLYLEASDIPAGAVYGRVLWVLENSDAPTNEWVIDGLRVGYANDVIVGSRFDFTDPDGILLGSMGASTLGGIKNINTETAFTAHQLVQAKSATFTADLGVYLCTNTITANLTSASSPLKLGRTITIKNVGSGVVTLDGSGSQTIDGATTFALNPGQTIVIVGDASNWQIVEFYDNAPGGKYAANVGDGTSTSITVTHNLGTRDVIVQVYDNSTPYAQMFPTVQHTSTSAVTLIFTTAPTSNQYRVVVRK